jgi:tRNA dimethylallyltransferase
MNTVIVILGPTASGKTEVSIELSKLIDCEIISVDSRQIYRYLDIGTAKPTIEELSQVKHHFIDIINPDEYFSAGLFENQGEVVIRDIFAKKKFPLLVGGSGLYIKALCEGLFNEDVGFNIDEIRNRLTLRFENEGIDNLYIELCNFDIDSANLYKDKNPRRILRALEYYHLTGLPLSKAHKEKKVEKTFKTLYFGIRYDKEEIYKRINLRTELMWEKGLEDETNKVLKMGFSPELNSLNTVGYKECLAYLKNEITKNRAIELTKQNTRRYAKRQSTWFRKNKDIIWLDGGYNKMVAENILKELKIYNG